jgi:hypothetical protein
MRQDELAPGRTGEGKGLCQRPALAWLALAVGLVALSWPFWAAASFRSPWSLFLYLFLVWAVMVAGLIGLGQTLARRCDPDAPGEPDDPDRLGAGGDV